MHFEEVFKAPPREYTLIPFWFLNDDLDEDEMRRQLDDFAAHGVYGVIPHARIGLSERIGYMSDTWLHYIRVCVEHAAANGMVVVLYDEGMYPSGSCCGKVVAENPRYATRCLERRAKGPLGEDERLVLETDTHVYVNRRSGGHIRGVHYGQDDGDSGAPPSADLLNPEAMQTFFRLALDGYYDALGEHFGKTITAIFTDEPDVLGRGHLRGVEPWTWDMDVFCSDYLGYDLVPLLPVLFERDHPEHARVNLEFERAVNARLEQVYYAPYSTWCREHGVQLTGHPAQPDDIGTLKHFHLPGQDIVWRYIEPFEDKSIEGAQSTMAKCSVSAQRHYGRPRNANECFGAYGWEFTEDEMWWVTNWLFVRGVNCLYPHAFYYSVRGQRRDERPPDVGPNNVWWPRYKTFADYCRRLSWLLSQGRHVCHFAILGTANSLPWRAARVMFESQRDFNYLDRDTLLDVCEVDGEGIRIKGMHYRAVVVDGLIYTDDVVVSKLQPLLDAGRVIAYAEAVPGLAAPVAEDAAKLVATLDAVYPPDVVLTPADANVRYTHMQQDDADYYVFSTEGRTKAAMALEVAAEGPREWWDPVSGELINHADASRLEAAPYRIRVLRCERV